ncbi:MAG: spore germination protein, partial [Clostridia bacterium]|nr:spore germination protein [Clostridia bacterium]
IYVDSITDKETLGLEVISPLKRAKKTKSVKILAKDINLANVQIKEKLRECANDVLSGNTVIIFDGINKALSIDLKKFEVRAISEPPTGLAIKGPRNGFTESIKSNLSLVRRYLKSTDCKVENFTIGKYTNTAVSLLYIQGICNDGLVDKIRKKLKKINIDGIPDSSYIAKALSERKTSLFKQTGLTERPDVFIERMLEGRIGIIVDGSPFVLTLPYILLEDFQSAEDYYISTYRANLVRALRIISLIFSILLPGAFVAAQLFHLQLIPLDFLLTIVNSIKEIPFSPSLVMFFVLLIFEILNETSVRMPKYVGMVVSIVGGLVLGETAVTAGIISAPTLMIVALSGICLYTVPELVQSFSIIRIVLLIVSGSFGLYGLLCALAVFIVS